MSAPNAARAMLTMRHESGRMGTSCSETTAPKISSALPTTKQAVDHHRAHFAPRHVPMSATAHPTIARPKTLYRKTHGTIGSGTSPYGA